MQKIIFILLFIYSYSAFADLKNKIRDINPLTNIQSSQKYCPSCLVEATGATDGKLMQSCVETICPKADFSLSTMLKESYEGRTTESVYKREVAPLVQRASQAAMKNKKSEAESLLAWLPNAEKIKDPNQIRLYNFFNSLAEVTNTFKHKYVGNQLMVDEAASRNLFDGTSDREFKNKVRRANVILNELGPDLFDSTDPARVRMSSGGHAKQQAKAFVDSLSSRLTALQGNTELGFFFKIQGIEDQLSGESIRAEIENAGDLSPDTISKLNSLSRIYGVYEALTKDVNFKAQFDSGPIDLKKRTASSKITALLNRQINGAIPIVAGTLLIESDSCRAALSLAETGLPTDKENKDFLQKIEKQKSDFVSTANGLICKDKRSDFRKEVKSWQPNLPMSREEFLPAMKAALERETQNQNKSLLYQKELNDSPYQNLMNGLSVIQLGNDVSPSQNVDEVCERLTPDLLPDAASETSNGYVVGPIVVRRKEASNITTHELGHKLYGYLERNGNCGDSNKFESIKKCLLSNHTEIRDMNLTMMNLQLSQKKDFYYGPEDFSDLIAGNSKGEGANFACLLARKDKTEDYKNLHLRNNDSADSHSSDLFRLLHMNFLRTGSTPTQCTQALLAQGESVSFKNCLKED
jgi:hypothetical protein